MSKKGLSKDNELNIFCPLPMHTKTFSFLPRMLLLYLRVGYVILHIVRMYDCVNLHTKRKKSSRMYDIKIVVCCTNESRDSFNS